jgi:hypothetical protein
MKIYTSFCAHFECISLTVPRSENSFQETLYKKCDLLCSVHYSHDLWYCDGLLPVQPNPRYNCAVATQRRSDIRGNG